MVRGLEFEIPSTQRAEPSLHNRRLQQIVSSLMQQTEDTNVSYTDTAITIQSTLYNNSMTCVTLEVMCYISEMPKGVIHGLSGFLRDAQFGKVILFTKLWFTLFIVLESSIFEKIFKKIFFAGHKSFSWGNWYPCFWLLVISVLGFKARMDQSLECFFAYVPQIPQIHLWCYTCQPLDN